MSSMEHWMGRPSQLGPAHLGSTSSSSSSTQSGGSGNAGRLADSMAHAHISHLAHTHLAHTHLGQAHHQQSHLSQSHHGIGHLSLKRKGALSVAENGGSLRRSCEFGSDMLWPPPLESEGQPGLVLPSGTGRTGVLRSAVAHRLLFPPVCLSVCSREPLGPARCDGLLVRLVPLAP